MKKADMEFDHRRYHERMAEAHAAERNGLYEASIESARAAWPHIDGMMRYANKYEDETFESLEAVELVLKYAPLTFDAESLDALTELLRSARRIERNTETSLADRIETTRQHMWDNHRLWDRLETEGSLPQNDLSSLLGGDLRLWAKVCEAWEWMGIVERTMADGVPYVSLATRLDAIVSAKCPRCGITAEAPKAMFIESMRCPGCGASERFVILSPATTVATGD